MVRIDFKRLRFLVIDDNAHMRRILRTMCTWFGTREVYEAEDGATGLEAFTHYMPDIVLTDWFMPIFDGLELAQMIRQPGANANPYVPIIMLTGHSEKKRVLSARDAGITEFLAKPIFRQGALRPAAAPRNDGRLGGGGLRLVVKSFGHQLVAEQARLLARGFGGEAPQQREQRRDVAQRLLAAAGEHTLDHTALEPDRAAGLADESTLVHGLDRGLEGGIGRRRQPGPIQQRPQPGAAAVVHQR
jgi:CheY-like chemotaxis protein